MFYKVFSIEKSWVMGSLRTGKDSFQGILFISYKTCYVDGILYKDDLLQALDQNLKPLHQKKHSSLSRLISMTIVAKWDASISLSLPDTYLWIRFRIMWCGIH